MSRKLGIALGSGGARGWAHIGVLRALSASHVAPDIVCGTSIGAVIGALHLAGKLPAFAQYLRTLNRMRLGQFFDFKFGGGGMIAGNRVVKVLEPIFRGMKIEQLPHPFACVATDLSTGDEVWLREGRIVDALKASYAIPGFFPPAQVGSKWLCDGALCNPVPVSLCRALGAEVVIAVDINAGILQPLGSESEEAEVKGAGEGPRRAYFSHKKGGPSAFGVVTRSLQISQTRLSRIRLAEDPPAVLLRPDVGHIGPLDFHRAAECIDLGETAMRLALPMLGKAMAAD